MDLWLKIGSALLLGAMVIMLIPRAREMVRNTRPGTAQEWLTALVPLALVAGLVVLLVMSVR